MQQICVCSSGEREREMAGKREALAWRDIGTTRIQQRNRAPAKGKYQALKHVAVSKEELPHKEGN